MADPLSVAAGIVGLLAFAGTALTKGYCVLRSLQGSKNDVERLLAELSQLTGVLVAIEAQEKEIKKNSDVERREASSVSEILESSIPGCRKMMDRVSNIIQKLERSRRAVLVVKWQFLEPDIRKSIQDIEHYKTVFTLCIGIDVRYVTHNRSTWP